MRRRVFPDGLIWQDGGFGTPATHSIYSLLGGDAVTDEVLVAPQGFEPRLSESESLVLPLNEGATGGLLRPRDAVRRHLLECTRHGG